MKLRSERDRGAVAIEAALITGLLVMIAIGAFEFGMAFRSSFGVAAASRQGARIGASVGQGATSGPMSNDDADCSILEATAAALKSTSDDEVVRIRIGNFDTASDSLIPSQINSYRPFIFTGGSADDPALLRCESWFIESFGWPESTRDNLGEDRDWLAVEVEFEHAWITGFAWWNGTIGWTNRSVMRMEPVSYG